MELQGHILIPESYIASLISTHVYKQCKITVTVVVYSSIQNKLLFYGKTILHIYMTDGPLFQKNV